MSPPQGASRYSCCSNKIKILFILFYFFVSHLFPLTLLSPSSSSSSSSLSLSLSRTDQHQHYEPLSISNKRVSVHGITTPNLTTSASLPLNIRMLFTAGFCLDSIWVWMGFGWVQFGFCLAHFNQYRSPVVCTLY